MARWPSVEKALISAHREDTGIQTGTKIPANVGELEQFVRLSRGPGSDDLITDSTVIDVECFSTDYGTADSLAEDVRQWFHSLNGRQVGLVLVDRVRTDVAPSWVDYRNPDTNRFVASYRLEQRKHY